MRIRRAAGRRLLRVRGVSGATTASSGVKTRECVWTGRREGMRFDYAVPQLRLPLRRGVCRGTRNGFINIMK